MTFPSLFRPMIHFPNSRNLRVPSLNFRPCSRKHRICAPFVQSSSSSYGLSPRHQKTHLFIRFCALLFRLHEQFQYPPSAVSAIPDGSHISSPTTPHGQVRTHAISPALSKSLNSKSKIFCKILEHHISKVYEK